MSFRRRPIMKKAITLTGVIGAFILAFTFTTCDIGGSSGGTLTIEIAGCPSGAEDCKLYVELYNAGSDPLSSSPLATGSILLNIEESDVMVDPLSDEDIALNAGEYDLYLWIDVNDNIGTVQQPETGVDMSHVSCPLRITIDRDTRVVITADSFRLFYGWGDVSLSGYYIYAELDGVPFEWKCGLTEFANDAFGIVTTSDVTMLFAALEVATNMMNLSNVMMIQFEGASTGTYTMSDQVFGGYVFSDASWMFTDITLIITTFEDVGGVIKGTFTGVIQEDGSSNTKTVENGQFNVLHIADPISGG
jgi:hypothetical protein